jgi:hypothetical protein
MSTTEIALPTGDTDGSESVFLRREIARIVRNCSRDSKGDLFPKAGLPDPEGLAFQFIQGRLNQMGNDVFHRN